MLKFFNLYKLKFNCLKLYMTPIEIKFVLWALAGLLSVLAFIGALGVNALIKMARDINEIKVSIKEQEIKHDSLEERVTKVEHKLKIA